MTELDNLISHLGIADNFNILGQSWGGSNPFYRHTSFDRSNRLSRYARWKLGCDSSTKGSQSSHHRKFTFLTEARYNRSKRPS